MNEQVKTAEMDAEESLIQVEPPQEKTAKTGVIAWFALLLTLLLAGSLAVVGYWAWPQLQQLQQQQQLQTQNQQQSGQQVAQTITALAQQTEQMQLAVQQFSQWQQQQTQTQQQYRDQLQLLQQEFRTRDGAPPQHWVLMEVRYLLQRANQNLLLQQDIQSARWLLQAADKRLSKLDNNALFPVRQAIQADLDVLKNIELPDQTALHAQLAQLRLQSMQLPIKQQQEQLSKPTEISADIADWRANLAAYWHKTWSALFQVRAAVPEDFYTLTAEQVLTIRLSLQQQVTLAEMALLQQQPAVYQAALRQAADLVQRFFAAEHVSVQGASSVLVTLAATEVAPPSLPALQSVPQLEQYIAALPEVSYE